MKESSSADRDGTSKSLKRQREKEKKIKREKRTKKILYGTLIAALVFSFFWLIALSTDHWAYLVLPRYGVKLPSRQANTESADNNVGGDVPSAIVTKLYIGLWRHCRNELTNTSSSISKPKAMTSLNVEDQNHSNGSNVEIPVRGGDDDDEINSQNHTAAADNRYKRSEPDAIDSEKPTADVISRQNEFCTRIIFYPNSEEIEDFGLDQGLLDYRRAATGMAIIGVIISVMANSFCYYSIVRPRYVIRRLAGCMQLGAAACLVVCIEIFEGGLGYAQSYLPLVYPPQTLYIQFGFSYGLAWVCFTIFVLAGLVFLFHSKKDKSTDKDQPVNIGRI